MSKVRDAGLERLKRRVTRLARLIELKAPDTILVNEATMIAEAGEMVDSGAYYRWAKRHADLRHKRMLGICRDEGCEEPVAWTPSAETPTCPGPFHDESCEKHAKEAEQEMAQDDDEDDLS